MVYTLFNVSSGAILHNVSVSTSALSLRDAFTIYERPPELGIGLYSGACNNLGLQNCSASCSDASALFGSLETLHNCLLYPAVAQLYINGSLGDAHLADSLGIHNKSQADQTANNITTTIKSCLLYYCGSDKECQNSITNSAFYYGNYTRSTPENVYPSIYYIEPPIFQFDICRYAAPSSFLNADIGGIGVYISYWIQSGFALLGVILILLWSFGTYYLCFPILATRHGKDAKGVARELAASLRSKHLPSLTAALTDFQKAQCFFMMAINIAALVNKHRGGLDPKSLQQLYNNYILTRSISISGYLPVTLTLLGLHIVAMVSWYLLILSILTVGVAIITLVDLGSFSPSSSDLSSIASVASENKSLDNCGGMNLTVYCLQKIGQEGTAEWDPSNGAAAALGFCLAVLVFVVAAQSHAFTNPATRETRTWLLKLYDFCVVGFCSLRGFEFILALLYCFVPWPLSVHRYISYYTLAYLGYIFIISHLRHGRVPKAISKLKDDWFLFAADLITAILWFFFGLISLNIFAIFAWLLFTASTVRSMNQLHAHSRKFQDWTSACQSRCFGGPLLTTLPPPGKGPEARRWINLASVVKTAMVPVALTRRYVDKWKDKARVHDWPGKGRRMIVFMLYLTFMGVYVGWFRTFFIDLAWFADLVDQDSWGFGQVVAITVWAGPLCEYIHLELRGMKRGFQHRLIWPYKVIKDRANGPNVPSSAPFSQTSAAPSP